MITKSYQHKLDYEGPSLVSIETYEEQVIAASPVTTPDMNDEDMNWDF